MPTPARGRGSRAERPGGRLWLPRQTAPRPRAPAGRGLARSRTGGWLAWCCPDPPRTIRHERWWNVALRTVHLVGFGLLLGGHAWGIEPASLKATLWTVILSGAGLMALELFKTARWLALGKGLAVLLKLGLLLLVPVFWEARLPLLLAVTVIASVGAHMPSRYRHYSILDRRVLDPAAVPSGDGARDRA